MESFILKIVQQDLGVKCERKLMSKREFDLTLGCSENPEHSVYILVI